ELPCESIGPLQMTIRGRGNSSWKQAAKKPYKIKLDKKADVFGLGSNKHWALLANAFDPSLLRDRVTAWLGDQMGFEFTPRGVPVDVIMTGQIFGTHYLGSFYLTETVRVDTNRLEIDELKETDVDEPTITGGYLVQNALQVRTGSPDRFYTSRGVDWATETPSFDTEEDVEPTGDDEEHGPLGENAMDMPEELGDAYENHVQQQYIQQHIQKVEDALFEDGTGYRDLMDIESAAKYWLVNEFTKNNDAFSTGSTYIYKKRDQNGVVGKVYWGPLWDFDFGYDRNYTVDKFTSGHLYTKAMFTDREPGNLADEVLKQWPVMKAAADELTRDGGVIDRYYLETKTSGENDLKINHPDETTDYKEYVDKLKDWIKRRVAWMDENIHTVPDLVHKVRYVVDDTLWNAQLVDIDQEDETVRKSPSKEGCVFLGWADEDGQIVEAPFYPERDMTLTAQFVSNEEATHGEDIVFKKASDVTRPGYFRNYTIQYTVIPTDAQDRVVTWTSSNEDLATVDENGIVYYQPLPDDADSVSVVITGTLYSGVSRDFTLTIVRGSLPLAKAITPVEEEIDMTVGQQHGFTVVTEPDPGAIDFYEYISDDESVVTVDASGVLTAAGPGETFVRLL
ncbi:MAG: CotH kinase family protein, partial [Lachnospiraceae bacterium]|nr:CotH kinase family protein [Lachnospiraceae bacterium]